MKKLGIIFLSILVVALFAVPALAADNTLDADGTYGIDGSGHDFSVDQSTGGNGYDILTGADISCVGCHVPHNTNSEETGALFSDYYNDSTTDGPLTAPSKAPGATFTTNTKLCMSCHDGTMTVPQTAGTTTADTSGAGGTQVTMNENVITRDLNDDHPVGIEYNIYRFRSLTTTSYSSPSHQVWKADLNTGDETYALLTDNGVSNQVVSCYSCHDPHLDVDGMGGDEDSFLRVKPEQAWNQSPVPAANMSQAGENLCIQCHQK